MDSKVKERLIIDNELIFNKLYTLMNAPLESLLFKPKEVLDIIEEDRSHKSIKMYKEFNHDLQQENRLREKGFVFDEEDCDFSLEYH